MFKQLKRKFQQQRKVEIIASKRKEQLDREIKELLVRVQFEGECG